MHTTEERLLQLMQCIILYAYTSRVTLLVYAFTVRVILLKIVKIIPCVCIQSLKDDEILTL